MTPATTAQVARRLTIRKSEGLIPASARNPKHGASTSITTAFGLGTTYTTEPRRPHPALTSSLTVITKRLLYG